MSERDLTPAQEESVRALLASAKHTDPAPAHVVARLDEALDALVADRREVRAPVVTLASRRRRVASTALLAAAAVVVLGVGVTQVLPSLDRSGGDSSSSAGAGEDSAAPQDNAEITPDAADSRSAAGAAPSEFSAQEKAPLSDAPSSALTSAPGLKSQLRDLRLDQELSSYSAPVCTIADAGRALQAPVTYDGMPGVAVYRRPTAGHQRVDVYLCGANDPVRSVQIPAR